MPQFCIHDPGTYCPVCNPFGPRTAVYQIPYVYVGPTTTTTPLPAGIAAPDEKTNQDKPTPPAPADLTEAERFFDSVVRERRATGRQTYGRGLTHTDDYDWNRMAMEEAMDLAQYLAAENTRLRDRIAQQTKAIVELTAALALAQGKP